MKLYLIYLISKNTLYAISDKKRYVKLFLSERNSKLFKVIKKRMELDEYKRTLSEYNNLILYEIPLEDTNGHYTIIGTTNENFIIDSICENIVDCCYLFKVHFTENFPFNNEYKEILESLTTVSKNINDHPILQIDSMRLFYYIFKETFNENFDSSIDYGDNYIKLLMAKYNKYL